MTTIAFRDGIVACDTGVTTGGSQVAHMIKIVRNAKGDVAAVTGRADRGFKFLEWFQNGENGEAPQRGDTTDAYNKAAIFRADGRIQVFELHGAFYVVAPYYALGSGGGEALGAMWHGATAAEAVQCAICHDEGTFGHAKVLPVGICEAWPSVPLAEVLAW